MMMATGGPPGGSMSMSQMNFGGAPDLQRNYNLDLLWGKLQQQTESGDLQVTRGSWGEGLRLPGVQGVGLTCDVVLEGD